MKRAPSQARTPGAVQDRGLPSACKRAREDARQNFVLVIILGGHKIRRTQTVSRRFEPGNRMCEPDASVACHARSQHAHTHPSGAHSRSPAGHPPRPVCTQTPCLTPHACPFAARRRPAHRAGYHRAFCLLNDNFLSYITGAGGRPRAQGGGLEAHPPQDGASCKVSRRV